MYVDWLLNGAPGAPGWDELEGRREWQAIIDIAASGATMEGDWGGGLERFLAGLAASGALVGLREEEVSELAEKLRNVNRNDVYRLKRVAQVAITRAKAGGEGRMFEPERREGLEDEVSAPLTPPGARSRRALHSS